MKKLLLLLALTLTCNLYSQYDCDAKGKELDYQLSELEDLSDRHSSAYDTAVSLTNEANSLANQLGYYYYGTAEYNSLKTRYDWAALNANLAVDRANRLREKMLEKKRNYNWEVDQFNRNCVKK